MKLDFYYDVVCPYAYMAFTRIGEIARRHGAELNLKPILLGGVFRALEAPQVPASTWAPQRVERIAEDLLRYSRWMGIPLRKPADHPRRTVEAMRVLAAAPPERREALSLAFYKAYWEEDRPVSAPETLRAIAPDIDPEAGREALFANTDEAIARGVFGVPAIFVEDQLFWGQDRLDLVEVALGGARPADPPPSARRVRLTHDCSSPFAYLGVSQAAKVSSDVEWNPVLLGALFKGIGSPNVPLFSFSPPKQRYYLKDLQDWAAWWGVDFRFPSTFPVRTVLPQRVLLQEPRATLPLYRALWAQDRDISRPEVVREVLREAGLDEGLVEGAERPEVKEQLRLNTEGAAARGVCGVPTWELDGKLVWGQDRIPLLRAALAGELEL